MNSSLSTAVLCSVAIVATGCGDAAKTFVVLDNHYAPSPPTSRLTVYRAAWLAVRFSDAVGPSESSEPQSTVGASANTAYVILAPGWDATSTSPPDARILLQSRAGFEAHLNDTLHIPVDDSAFEGNCAVGSHLSQAQADFIAQLVFHDAFASLHYDAATCTTTSTRDAGAP